MVKKLNVIIVNKNNYKNYIAVADNFYQGADVAYEYEYYNAAGVLIVHSAIAWSDAITIKLQGIKNRGEDHHNIEALLRSVVDSSHENNTAIAQLFKIIQHKNRVSYSGDIYTKKDIDAMRKLIERYKTWVEKIIS